MLEIIEYIESVIKLVNSKFDSDDYLSYEIIDDNHLEIDFGWTSYEESDSNIISIEESSSYTVSYESVTCSVYGDAENKTTHQGLSLDDVKQYLKEHMYHYFFEEE